MDFDETNDEIHYVQREGFGLAWFNGGLFAVGGYEEARLSTERLEDANPEGEWKEHITIEGGVTDFRDLVLL